MGEGNGTAPQPQGMLVISFFGDEKETITINVQGPYAVAENKEKLIRGCAEVIKHLSAMDAAAVEPASALWTPGKRM